MQRLIDCFTQGIKSRTLETVGSEVETQFVTGDGIPISVAQSQQILRHLVDESGWSIEQTKGILVTTVVDALGNRICYELGRHNLELATVPAEPNRVLKTVEACMRQLYISARAAGAFPYFAPILPGDDDLLIIPDERDATWLELDGRDALAPLARISSVQFTVSVAVDDAINVLNTLGSYINNFLADFPQDTIWHRYIAESAAGYLPDRYGGPLMFDDLADYCRLLTRHAVVCGARLVPYNQVKSVNIPLYLRSIWWHFRLKRYQDSLCVEVRPLARRSDDKIAEQFGMLLEILGL